MIKHSVVLILMKSSRKQRILIERYWVSFITCSDVWKESCCCCYCWGTWNCNARYSFFIIIGIGTTKFLSKYDPFRIPLVAVHNDKSVPWLRLVSRKSQHRYGFKLTHLTHSKTTIPFRCSEVTFCFDARVDKTSSVTSHCCVVSNKIYYG